MYERKTIKFGQELASNISLKKRCYYMK